MKSKLQNVAALIGTVLLTAVALSASLLLLVRATRPDPVSTGQSDPCEEITVETIASGGIPAPSPRAAAIRPASVRISPLSGQSAYNEAYNSIYYALINYWESCDLRKYQLTKDVVINLFSDVLNHSPDLFFVDGGLKITYNKNTLIVSTVTFLYNMTKDEAAEALGFYTSELDAILSQMPAGMSEADKVLWIHDYLCIHYAYDESLNKYDACSFFRDKRGVCQSYTLAFMALARSCGIQTDFASSAEMNHIWNLVRLDGNWYHVDVTWDDPIHKSGSDIPGRAGHGNFLCSDTTIVRQKHYNWQSSYECASGLYDGETLDGINTALAWLDGNWYYADRRDGSIRQLIFPTYESRPLLSVQEIWHPWGQDQSYVYRYTNVCGYGGKLYYSTPGAVFVYDPATGISGQVVRYTGNDGSIYALRCDGPVLCYTVSKAPGGAAVTEYTYDLSAEPSVPSDYLNLSCGNHAALALVTYTAGEEGQNLRIVMIGSLSRLERCADPVFTVIFRLENSEVLRYTLEGDTLLFYQSLSAGDIRYTAAQGYQLFGVSVDKIPPDGWTDAVILLTDRKTGERLCERTIGNTPDLIPEQEQEPVPEIPAGQEAESGRESRIRLSLPL